MADILTEIMISEVKSSVNDKIKYKTFTSTTNGITNIVHNLDYNSSTDELLVFYDGVLMDKTDNYTENSNEISIDLVGWSLSSGDIIKFNLYKNVK